MLVVAIDAFLPLMTVIVRAAAHAVVPSMNVNMADWAIRQKGSHRPGPSHATGKSGAMSSGRVPITEPSANTR